MLLWLLSCVNLRLKNASILKSTCYNIIDNVAGVNGLAHASVVKILVFLIASVGANSYENDPNLVAFCDDSSMHLNVEFTKPFHGFLYTSGDPFIPSCSFQASPRLNNTKLMLTLPFRSCAFDVIALDEERISISGTIVIQQHRIVKTFYDTSLNATCVLYLSMNTFREWYYPNATLTAGRLYTGSLIVPEVVSQLETRIGSDLFPDNSEVEADLFLVISIRDGGENKGVSIQNCIAHDDEVVTNETLMYQLSDVYGCPNASLPLKNFTAGNQTDGKGDLMAYTRLEHVSLIAVGEFYVSCGVVLCKESCDIGCVANGSQSSHYLNDIAVKKFVRRHPGATIPSSLDNFDRRQNQRISKRSVSNWFSLTYAPGSEDSIFNKKALASNTSGTVWTLFKNDTDIVGFLTDVRVDTSSQDRIEKVQIFNGETTRLNVFVKDSESRKIWDRAVISLSLLIFLSCYCALFFWTRM